MADFPFDDGCSGIYAIVNTVTQEFYIGSSINMYQRYLQHCSQLSNHTHGNTELQAAYDRDGVHAFICIVIEYVNGDDVALRAGEAWYIDALQPAYNDKSGKQDGMNTFAPQWSLLDVQTMIQNGPYEYPRWTRRHPLGYDPYAHLNPNALIDVPLDEDVIRALGTCSQIAHMTRTAWIESAIREKLARTSE